MVTHQRRRPYLVLFPHHHTRLIFRLLICLIVIPYSQLFCRSLAACVRRPAAPALSSSVPLLLRLPIHMSSSSLSASKNTDETDPSFLSTVLFVECGFGNDSHGQNATKAAIRACRNAIEFNSIPSMAKIVPGGYDGLKLSVILAVPKQYQASLDLIQVQDVFPYGKVHFTIQDGGMVAPSGIAIDELGDTNDDMVVVCAAVSVGY